MLRLIIAVLFMATASLPAAADDGTPRDLGPAIGQRLPVPLDSRDHQGQPRNFEALSGENGLVLIFARSVEWCPYCQRQAIEANQHTGDFQSMGLGLALMTYDPVEKLARFAARQAIGYPLLSDEGSRIIDGFGLRNDTYGPDSVAFGVAHPAIFIIDKAGVVRAKLVEGGIDPHPSMQDILAAASPLAKP